MNPRWSRMEGSGMFGKHINQLKLSVAAASTKRWIGFVVLPGLVIATTGCRAPWQGSMTNEPSFDRLLDIEREQASQPSRNSMSQGKRPGRNTQTLPISLASQEEIESEKMQVDAESDPELHPLYVRAEAAALNSKAIGQAEKPNPTKLAKSKSGSRTISDFTDERDESVAQDEDAVVYKMSDGTLEQLGPDSKKAAPSMQQLAKEPVSSRRSDNDYASRISDSPVKQASYEASLRSSREDNSRQDDSRKGNAEPQESAARSSEGRYHTAPDDTKFGRPGPEAMDMNWEDHLRAAIADLNATQDSSASPEVHLQREVTARGLQVMIGDMDAAMQPIEGLQQHEQDYFRHQFQALSDAMDPEGNPVSSRRWSLVMLSARKAMEQLAAISNLEVNNAAFCTEVESFGVATKFPEYKFKPDQELLLYCELDNFLSESMKTGYETQLQGNYEIVDSNGVRTADQLLPMDSHVCRNRRRDYFIAYRMYMPQKAKPGNYTLKLTIEDMKGHKFGQAELDFEIVN
jgi:hypothetical protein